MKTKFKSFICPKRHPFSAVFVIAVALLFGVLASSAQTGIYLFTGSETTVTLDPGLYNITAYGAQGGGTGYYSLGSLGAEMEGEFNFTTATTLTLLVGGAGGSGGLGSGGGGGSFVVNGTIPLVVAGGGGGSGNFYGLVGGSGVTSSSGGGGGGDHGGSGGLGGGGGYSGGGGGFVDFGGGGGGSIIDSSAIMVLAEVSGIASPDGPTNGEIIITAVPEPTTLALAAISVLPLLLFRRQRK